MSDLIQSLISENTMLIGKMYNKIGALISSDFNDSYLKEVVVLLKINEIMIMEISSKGSFNNENKVVAALTLMQTTLQNELVIINKI